MITIRRTFTAHIAHNKLELCTSDFHALVSYGTTNKQTTHLIGSNDARTIRSHHATLRLTNQRMLDANHIVLGNSFGDAHNKSHFGFDSFQNCGCRAWWRHINNRCIGIGCCLCFPNLQKKIETYKIQSLHFFVRTVPKTGRPRCSLPAFEGDTPPTTFVL